MKKSQTHPLELLSQRISLSSLLCFSIVLMLVTLAFFHDALAFRRQFAPDPERIVAKLSEELQLTDTQVEQIRTIFENQTEKRKKIFEEYSSQGRDGRRALREEMRALKKDTDSQIATLLTEEQIIKYEALQEERAQKMRERRERSRKGAGDKTY